MAQLGPGQASRVTSVPIRRISPRRQRSLSLQKLAAYVRSTVFPYSPYYRRLFQKEGLDPEGFGSEEWLRTIPFTRKESVARDNDAFLLRPRWPGEEGDETAVISDEKLAGYQRASRTRRDFRSEVNPQRFGSDRPKLEFLREWQPILYQRTSGTTGRAVQTASTYWDIHNRFKRGHEFQFAVPGWDASTRFLYMDPAGLHIGIYGALVGPVVVGQPAISTFGGRVTPTEDAVRLAVEYRPQVVKGIASYVLHWFNAAVRMRREDRISPITSIRTITCAGETVTDVLRARLRALAADLGSPSVEVLQGIGSTELRSAGFRECREGSGLHIDPDCFYPEIVAPETGVPIADGAPGVLVWSHIDWRGTALLRYWSGDYVTGGMRWDRCDSCGIVAPRLYPPIARFDTDTLKIRGARVDAMELRDLLTREPNVAAGQFIVTRDPSTGRDLVRLDLAVKDGEAPEPIVAALRARFRTVTEAELDEVTLAGRQEIESRLFEADKVRWVVDKRTAALS